MIVNLSHYVELLVVSDTDSTIDLINCHLVFIVRIETIKLKYPNIFNFVHLILMRILHNLAFSFSIAIDSKHSDMFLINELATVASTLKDSNRRVSFCSFLNVNELNKSIRKEHHASAIVGWDRHSFDLLILTSFELRAWNGL